MIELTEEQVNYLLQVYVQEHPCQKCGAHYPDYFWSFVYCEYQVRCKECNQQEKVELQELENYNKIEGLEDFINPTRKPHT